MFDGVHSIVLQEGDELFHRADRRESYPRLESRMSMSTPERSANGQ